MSRASIPDRVVNHATQPAERQEGLSVSVDQTVPLEPFEFLAKYFTINALLAAESLAVGMGQQRAAHLFRKAANRTMLVGATKL